MKYSAKMKYSEETIGKLTQMQYDVFQYREKTAITLTSVLILFFGFYARLNSVFGIALFFIGCILMTSINTRPRANAKILIKQLNGSFPVLKYTFTDTGFASDQEEQETKYSSVIRLIESRQYLYIYVTQEKAYMIDSFALSPDDPDGFKKFVSAKTKLEWSRPFSLFSITIKSIVDRQKDKSGRN